MEEALPNDRMMKIENFPDRTVYPENKKHQGIAPVVERTSLPISVAIVSYNSRELLRACLASIEPEPWDQVTVVDNASSDGSDEMVRQDFPWVKLIKNQENPGYGAAANMAIASCSSRYVLLLNSDTLLQPGSLQTLSDYLDQHPQVAIAGPSLVNPDGTYQASCFPFPTPWQTLLRETSLPVMLQRFPKIQLDHVSMGAPRVARPVPWVLGAALAIRRQVFEALGGFDGSFFMYFEEVDLCYRLDQSGWQTHFVPAVGVTHVGGASTKQHRAAMAIQLYKSLCHFYQQHYSRQQGFQLKLVLTYLMVRNIVLDKYKLVQKPSPPRVNELAEDLLTWRSVLAGLWSKTGWLG